MLNSNVEALVALLEEIEAEDPIDYGDLPVDEGEMRKLAVLGIMNIFEGCKDMPVDQRMMILAASAAKLSLENMVLHMQLLRRKN